MWRGCMVCVAAGMVSAASVLDKAGDRVRGDDDRVRPPIGGSPHTGSENHEEGGSDWFWELSTSTTSSDHQEDSGSMFAGTPAPADRFATEPEAPAQVSGPWEPHGWHGDLELNGARRDADLWRWGGAGAVNYEWFGIRGRFDSWHEDDAGRPVHAVLTTVGPQLVVGDGMPVKLEIGLPLLIWHDRRGSELGLALSGRVSGRPARYVAWQLEVTGGGWADPGGEYRRFAGGVGPAWGDAGLLLGYEHVDAGGIYLGGPTLSLVWVW